MSKDKYGSSKTNKEQDDKKESMLPKRVDTKSILILFLVNDKNI